ncbi:MAG TPA: PilZ domain-containing protein [Xanthobacteraceae bacterium]|nr:PilZ domain-containing protein [Xanthobacteraceae bacterium]
MLERRAHPRSLTLKTGKIVPAGEDRDIACAILEISEGGACILVSDPADVPQTFLLKFDRTRTICACKRVWTKGNRIGLSFIRQPQAPGGARHD